jgi:hypothetical protein
MEKFIERKDLNSMKNKKYVELGNNYSKSKLLFNGFSVKDALVYATDDK